MKCAAVIAAAGVSSRMHDFKPLLCLSETTVIESIIRSLRSAGVIEIVVVTGYKAEILRDHLEPLKVHEVENTRFAETKMFDSICLGLQALSEPYDAVFLTPGDVPLVQPDTLRQMQEANAPMVRPVCNGETGHPVLLDASLVPELLCFDGAGGLRGAMESMDQPILNLEVQDIGVTMDADTPNDFKALKQQEIKLRSGGHLWPEIRIHIAKGDTVLTPENAQYLEMIGLTGSIQSACACMHMSYSRGWRLLNRMEDELGYSLVGRFPGGASGGGSVLTVKGQQLLAAYQDYQAEVRNSANRLFRKFFPEEF